MAIGGGALLAVDLLFFAANLTKLTHGAWLPLLIALVAFTVLTTWQRGRELVTAPARARRGPLRAFVDKLHDDGAAAAARARHRGLPQPRQGHRAARDARERRAQPRPARARRHPLDRDAARAARPGRRAARRSTTSATATTGSPTSPPASATWTSRTSRRLIPLIRRPSIETPLDDDDVSYFLSTIELHRGDAPGMSRWRKRLFLATSRITADAAEYFHLPREQHRDHGLAPRPLACGAALLVRTSRDA